MDYTLTNEFLINIVCNTDLNLPIEHLLFIMVKTCIWYKKNIMFSENWS